MAQQWPYQRDSTLQIKYHNITYRNVAALSFADTIRRNMDQGMFTGVVFIDLRKVFYTVNYDLLLRKLFGMDVLDKELAWFKDYLKDRTQVLDFQGVLFDPEPMSVGVPQCK